MGKIRYEIRHRRSFSSWWRRQPLPWLVTLLAVSLSFLFLQPCEVIHCGKTTNKTAYAFTSLSVTSYSPSSFSFLSCSCFTTLNDSFSLCLCSTFGRGCSLASNTRTSEAEKDCVCAWSPRSTRESFNTLCSVVCSLRGAPGGSVLHIPLLSSRTTHWSSMACTRRVECFWFLIRLHIKLMLEILMCNFCIIYCF